MHSPATVSEVLRLGATGLGARRVAAATGVPVATVTCWLRGQTPRGWNAATPPPCARCGAAEHAIADRPQYSYLLGLYLGDGCISPHARGVFKMRIVLDAAYPGIIAEAEAAIAAVAGGRSNSCGPRGNCVEVYGYSKTWPCLFPQHGAGKKHERPIELADWQVEVVKAAPEQFLRGLIHSDGCRFENTGRGEWRAPRYKFDNRSDDVIALFCWACELLGLHWTESGDTIYVSRKADVARMDEYIGPKR